MQTGQCQHTLEGHLDYVNSIDVLVRWVTSGSGSCDITVRMWIVLIDSFSIVLQNSRFLWATPRACGPWSVKKLRRSFLIPSPKR